MKINPILLTPDMSLGGAILAVAGDEFFVVYMGSCYRIKGSNHINSVEEIEKRYGKLEVLKSGTKLELEQE